MPKAPVPAEIEDFLSRPNPAVIASVGEDGSPHTAATWYLWEDGRFLVNMDRTRRRLRHMRQEPRVSLTVLGAENWYQQVTLRGRVVEIQDDPDLEGADRLSRHYMGEPYARREQERVNAWVEVESWYGWSSGEPWAGD